MNKTQLRWYTGAIILAVLVSALLQLSVLIVKVDGHSMEPTLQDKSTYVILKSPVYKREQLASFKWPESWGQAEMPNTKLIKRIIAIPGDTVSTNGQAILVNGKVRHQLPVGCRAPHMEKTLGPEEVFVTGDNSGNSLDSRARLCEGASSFTVPTNLIEAHGRPVLK